jgi:hypothetical protein
LNRSTITRFASFAVATAHLFVRLGIFTGILAFAPAILHAQALVPGTVQKVPEVGDDFEDPKWFYNLNSPKSSEEQDGQDRLPAGRSVNGRWAEGLKRGHPDVVKRVATPPGGLPGSEGSMLMKTLYTGVPGVFSGQTKQDDLICMVDTRLGQPIPASWSPSVVTHVYLPAWDQWERRNGNSFAFRAAVQTHTMERYNSGRFFGASATRSKLDTYWPGILIRFNPGDGGKTPDTATLVLRANRNGGDYDSLQIKQPGWWTLGMSFTPDGQVHYYAHAGVEPLTEKDRLASEYPYGCTCEQVETFFFDVLNGDNGNWSTPWVVDDSFVYWNRK